MDVTVGIPVKGYLKKYILWKENYPADEIIELSGDGEIPIVLSGLLRGKLTYYDQYREDEKLKEYDAELLARLTLNHYNRQLLFYTRSGVRFFNKFIWRNFHETLLSWIMLYEPIGVSEKDCILHFMDTLNITEDDISFDAIKKSSYRLRKSRNLPLFRVLGGK
jgi:hypothetical protein